MEYQIQEMTRELTCQLNWEAVGLNSNDYQQEQDEYLFPR